MEQHFKYVAEKFAEIESYCAENNHLTYSEMEGRVILKFEMIEEYAKENKVPIKLDLDSIIDRHAEPDYEEESSSYYYEEEESNYDDDEDEEVNSWD